MTEVLLEYGCMQALNLDGGTSAIMYYDGEYVTRCSNTAIPSGRTMPSAWVYKKNS
jgi:exopolysaccharide biosynthesis protein